VSVLTEQATHKVQKVIDDNIEQLREIPGFVAAEPGFPLVDGAFITKPAIIVLVNHKQPQGDLLDEDRAPRTLGGYRVQVMQADPVRQLEALDAAAAARMFGAAAAVPLTYTPIEGNPIDKPFTVSKALLCHVGPDAGWPVLQPFLNAARHTLSVAIYDFNAAYIATALVESGRAHGLDITMNWDDTPPAPPEPETIKSVRTKLRPRFHDLVVKTGSGRRFANSYHEKVAVRDSSAFWLSSGNWTKRSQPDIDPVEDPASGAGMYGKYNREWHVVIEDEELAKLFERYIRYDFDQSQQEAEEDRRMARPAIAPAAFPDLFVPIDALVDPVAMAAKPEPVAPATLPAGGRDIEIQPVLTPDNYVQRVTSLLKSAKHSIYMQFAYINYSDAEEDEAFTEMLDVLKKMSNRADIDTRVIVGSTDAATKVGLLVKKGFNQDVFRQQANIHNKGIVVDAKAVLVSSANWSGDGVLRNRDAGLIIHDPDIASYYEAVFLDDWDKRATNIKESKPVIVAKAGAKTPPGMVRISWNDYMDN
jgi:phosphatidylserine/phosphatidylglycerophosphate/cardiolipin synthase-like enzyme